MDPALYAERRIGARLRDKWTLEKLIGVGGMAAVYVGVHKIGQRAAIKILHPEVARSPELRARFEQEAHAVNRFKHPGAVEIRDIDVTEDGAPFLVMELLDGASVAELAERPSGVALGEVLRLVDELLDVLVAAHAEGIIHRDIKPDNLFVTSDGRLKVLDFGIARMRAGVGALHTRAGAMLGTAPYMAPEQILGRDIDARVDVFAVGATMFRLLARRRIHEAETEPALLVKMATLPAPPLASVAPGVPREVALLVDRALVFDREGRYPDAAAMQRDVRAVLGPRAPASPVTTEEAPKPPAQAERTKIETPNAQLATAATVVPARPPLLVAEPSPEPPARSVVVRPALAGAVAGAMDLTVPVAFHVGAVPTSGDARRRDERKTVLILVLAVALLLALALVVFLLARPTTGGDGAASDPPPPADDSPDPPAREPPPRELGGPRPPEGPPRPQEGPPQGRGKGHGPHGHGKHKGREDE